jgi:hypothetical protein
LPVDFENTVLGGPGVIAAVGETKAGRPRQDRAARSKHPEYVRQRKVRVVECVTANDNEIRVAKRADVDGESNARHGAQPGLVR